MRAITNLKAKESLLMTTADFVDVKDAAASPFPRRGFVSIYQANSRGPIGEPGDIIAPTSDGEKVAVQALPLIFIGATRGFTEWSAAGFNGPPLDFHALRPLDATPVKKGNRDIYVRPSGNTVEQVLYVSTLAHVDDKWIEVVVPHQSTALTPGQLFVDLANDAVTTIDGVKARGVGDVWTMTTVERSNAFGHWHQPEYRKTGAAPIELQRRALGLRIAHVAAEKERFDALAAQEKATLIGGRPRGTMTIESGRVAIEAPKASPFPKRPNPEGRASEQAAAARSEECPFNDDIDF